MRRDAGNGPTPVHRTAIQWFLQKPKRQSRCRNAGCGRTKLTNPGGIRVKHSVKNAELPQHVESVVEPASVDIRQQGQLLRGNRWLCRCSDFECSVTDAGKPWFGDERSLLHADVVRESISRRCLCGPVPGGPSSEISVAPIGDAVFSIQPERDIF